MKFLDQILRDTKRMSLLAEGWAYVEKFENARVWDLLRLSERIVEDGWEGHINFEYKIIFAKAKNVT